MIAPVATKTISIFISCSNVNVDSIRRKELEKHLHKYVKSNRVKIEHSHNNPAGHVPSIYNQALIDQADIALIFMTPDYNSETGCDDELRYICEKYRQKDIFAFLLHIRDVDYQSRVTQGIPVLPKNEKFINDTDDKLFRELGTCINEKVRELLSQQDIKEGQECLHQKNYNEALEKFTRALEFINNLPQALNIKAQALIGKAQAEFELERYQIAACTYQAAIGMQPENYQLYIKCARSLIGQAQHEGRQRAEVMRDEALKHLDTALAFEPKDITIYIAQGEIYKSMSDFAAALKVYQKACEIDSQNYKWYKWSGIMLAKLHEFEKAAPLLEKALKLASEEDYEIYQQLSVVYTRLKKSQQAESALNKAYKLNPKSTEILLMLGKMQQKFKNYEEALRSFNTVLKYDSSCTEAYKNRGEIALEQKNYEFAYANYESASRLEPNNALNVILMGHALFLQGKKSEEALQKYREAEKLDTTRLHINQPTFCYRVGILLSAINQNQEAVEYFKKAAQSEPRNVPYALKLARCQTAIGQANSALQTYTNIIKNTPTCTEAHYEKGVIEASLQRFSAAKESLENALQLNNKQESYYNTYLEVLQKLSLHTDMLEVCDYMITHMPEFAMAYERKGYALQILGKYQAAVDNYDRALALSDDYKEAHLGKGYALIALGKSEEALIISDELIRKTQRTYAHAHNLQGNALFELKQFNDAMGSYDAAIELTKEPVFQFNKAYLLYSMRKYKEAAIVLQDVIVNNPQYITASMLYRETLHVMGKHKEVIIFLDKMLELNPNNTQLLYKKGRSHFRTGRFLQGFKTHQQVRHSSPTFKFATEDKFVQFVGYTFIGLFFIVYLFVLFIKKYK